MHDLFNLKTGDKKGRKVRFNPTPNIPDTGWRKNHLFPDLSGAKAISFDVETKDPGIDDFGAGWGRGVGHVIGVAIGTDDGFKNYYPIRHEAGCEDNYRPADVFSYLNRELGRRHQTKVGHNMMYDLGWLAQEGVKVEGPLWDSRAAEKVLNFFEPASLEASAQRRGIVGKDSKELYEWCWQAFAQTKEAKSDDGLRRNAMQNLYRCPPRLVGGYAESDVRIPIELARKQKRLLVRSGVWDVFDLECRLMPVLVAMRMRGVSVDMDAAEKAHAAITLEIAEMQKGIDRVAGRTGVNTKSPKEMETVFKNLGLRPVRTPGGQVSLAADTLKAMNHPITKMIVDIEELKKYNSTFIEGYILTSSIGGRIHAEFDQFGAKTGRFSCVHKDTEIPTERRGSVKIVDLLPTDRVFTHKGRWRRVERLIVKPVSDMFDVTFSNGHVLKCTGEHRLLTDQEKWVSLRDVCIKETSERSCSSCNGSRDLLQFIADEAASGRSGWGNLPHCRCNPIERCSSGFTEDHAGSQILCLQGGGEESYEGEVGGEASQLQGGLRRSSRVSNEDRGWQTLFRASNCDGRDPWYSRQGAAVEHGGSSHRREPFEQLPGQPGSMHGHGAQRDPREIHQEQAPVRITRIDYGGSHQVYDITVEEDHSYLCCGIFNHNSKDPNLQNVPSRNDLAARVRRIFIPDEGHEWWRKYDYSSIENRIFAEFARGKAGKKLRQQYIDDPLTDYHNWCLDLMAPIAGWDISTEEKYKKKRKPIKNINFGIVYGMGDDKLANDLGIGKAEATELMGSYHTALPHVKETMTYLSEQADAKGYSETILGRKVIFDSWEPAQWSATPLPPLPRSQALATYGFNIRKSGLYKATNYTIQGTAADLMKMAMVQCWEQGIFDETGVPVLTVHDELDFSEEGGHDPAFLEMVHVMESAIPLRVPIRVEGEIGKNWSDLKSIPR